MKKIKKNHFMLIIFLFLAAIGLFLSFSYFKQPMIKDKDMENVEAKNEVLKNNFEQDKVIPVGVEISIRGENTVVHYCSPNVANKIKQIVQVVNDSYDGYERCVENTKKYISKSEYDSNSIEGCEQYTVQMDDYKTTLIELINEFCSK